MSRFVVTQLGYCQDVQFPEDLGFCDFIHDGCRVVIGDGVDHLHNKKTPRRLVSGESQAQIQVRNLKRCFLNAHPDEPLMETIRRSVSALAQWATSMGIPLDRADELPGIDLAVVKVGAQYTDLFQVGNDALAFWLLKSGEMGATPNRGAEFVRRKGPLFARYQAEFGVAEAWNKMEDVLRKARIDLTNTSDPGAYGTMNGQPGVSRLWVNQRFANDDLSSLLLLTDGLYDYDESQRDPQGLTQKIFTLFQQGGLQAIYEARGAIKSGEGTGAAIEFN